MDERLAALSVLDSELGADGQFGHAEPAARGMGVTAQAQQGTQPAASLCPTHPR